MAWFIVDDHMPDDRRIKRLPLASVGLWVKLCTLHCQNLSQQANNKKEVKVYLGYFDRKDIKDVGGTMRQFQQLVDAGLMEEYGEGWRPVYIKGICREPKIISEKQRIANKKNASNGGFQKAANRKAREAAAESLAKEQPSAGETSGESLAESQRISGETSAEIASEFGMESLTKSCPITDTDTETDTDNPSPTPPSAESPDDGFASFAGSYPGSVGAKGRKTEAEARSLYAAIAGNPVELTRLQTALRHYRRAVNDGQVPQRQVPRLATWLRDQWQTWAPEPATSQPRHNHTWNCNHVHQLMDPHEDEYDHTGSLRGGHPSEWWQACQACAEELNQQQQTSKEKQ